MDRMTTMTAGLERERAATVAVPETLDEAVARLVGEWRLRRGESIGERHRTQMFGEFVRHAAKWGHSPAVRLLRACELPSDAARPRPPDERGRPSSDADVHLLEYVGSMLDDRWRDDCLHEESPPALRAAWCSQNRVRRAFGIEEISEAELVIEQQGRGP